MIDWSLCIRWQYIILDPLDLHDMIRSVEAGLEEQDMQPDYPL